MQAALKLHTTVLPRHRIEITAPELPEDSDVEVIIVLPERPSESQAAAPARTLSMLEFIQTLPPGPRSASTWEEVERNFQEERNAWCG